MSEAPASDETGEHHFARYLRDVIYGALDGAVTTFAVVSGVAGAGLSPKIVLVLGAAGVIGDGFSMAAGNYLGTKADNQRRDEASDEPDPDRSEPWLAALVTFGAFLIAGAIPLIPYIAAAIGFDGVPLGRTSTMLTLITFFVIGAGKAFVVPTRWWVAGLESLAIGAAAAGLAYGCGVALSGLVE